MSIAEVENMTLAQKKMASMIMEDTAPEVEALRAAQAAADIAEDEEMANANEARAATTAAEEQRRKEAEEAERIRAAQAANTALPMKVRKDYVPKSKQSAFETPTLG